MLLDEDDESVLDLSTAKVGRFAEGGEGLSAKTCKDGEDALVNGQTNPAMRPKVWSGSAQCCGRRKGKSCLQRWW